MAGSFRVEEIDPVEIVDLMLDHAGGVAVVVFGHLAAVWRGVRGRQALRAGNDDIVVVICVARRGWEGSW